MFRTLANISFEFGDIVSSTASRLSDGTRRADDVDSISHRARPMPAQGVARSIFWWFLTTEATNRWVAMMSFVDLVARHAPLQLSSQ